MTDPKSSFKENSVCIEHRGYDLECFQVADAAYMLFAEDGQARLALETSTLFIEADDSELVGASEIMVRLWGLPARAEAVENGLPQAVRPKVDSWKHKKGHVMAQFFANEFYGVKELSVSFPGPRRLQAMMKIADITEQTERFFTTIWLDCGLMSEPSALERPE